MKYRVSLNISYYKAYFEFDSLDKAGEFAKTVLVNMVDSEDTKKKTSVSIQVIGEEEEQEDGGE